jgi:hypothetical protein
MILFTGAYAGGTGTGFGAIDNVLTLQHNVSESGGVSWNGSADVLTGDAKNTSETLTANFLSSPGGANISWNAVTGANFDVIFQVNQASGQTLDLHTFQLDFYNAQGGKLQPSVVYNDTGNPSSAALGGVGVGTSGWIFDVHLTGSEAAAFFGTGTNRLGMSVLSSSPINNLTNDGPENFYVAANQSIVATPAPPSVVLLGVGALCCLGGGLWHQRRQRRRLLTAA